MFWNTEFLTVSSRHDELLSQSTKLSDIIFEEELLQELKTSNMIWVNFLTRPAIIQELVDNITQLTEKDCFDKLLHSRIHAAYISCEILTSGSTGIFSALMEHPESLNKIMTCLIREPADSDQELKKHDESDPEQEQKQDEEQEPEEEDDKLDGNEKENDKEKEKKQTNEHEDNDEKGIEEGVEREQESEVDGRNEGKENEKGERKDLVKEENENETPEKQVQVPETNGHDGGQSSDKIVKIVPQKATLVSKLINTIHSNSPADLSCYITKNVETFSQLIDVLLQNIHISGPYDILSTFISRTNPPESRYVFCEILAKLDFVNSLINVMTSSEIEDKQRNACQLLCDIIVHGRQEAIEQQSHIIGPPAQDMLAEQLESQVAVLLMLSQMFNIEINATAIICGIKVLRCLIEWRRPHNNILPNDAIAVNVTMISNTMNRIQDIIEEFLKNFHELLLNPPKQEPIKTTFGIIQKPLGYIRLEVVNLIRALISVNSAKIILKLVELHTMKVIIDLFFDYSWNNLLHTQVEQALCLIIKICRHDEELFFAEYWNKRLEESKGANDSHESDKDEKIDVPATPAIALLDQILNDCNLIGRLLQCRNGEANFGHIIQMINSIAINGDLDTIKSHLKEIETKRPELFDRWTTFVSVDVASFKETSSYFDIHSQRPENSNGTSGIAGGLGGGVGSNAVGVGGGGAGGNGSVGGPSGTGNNSQEDTQLLTYISFTREQVLPTINVKLMLNRC